MAREYTTADNCEVLYEGFKELAPGSIGLDVIRKASAWIHAEISEFHPEASSALPSSGISPNFWVRTATESEAIYLAIVRRQISNGEESKGYWDMFHEDARAILQNMYDGKYRLDPDPKLALKGIGIAEAIDNDTVSAGDSDWLESNRNVPANFYEDDIYNRHFYVEIEDLNSTLDTSTFRWKTNLSMNGWEASGVMMDWEFIYLSHGVRVRFLPGDFAEFVEGMMWRISCYPERDQKNRAMGGSTAYLER